MLGNQDFRYEFDNIHTMLLNRIALKFLLIPMAQLVDADPGYPMRWRRERSSCKETISTLPTYPEIYSLNSQHH
jgi:hypothetical protein